MLQTTGRIRLWMSWICLVQMFTVGCSPAAFCCQSIKKQLIFRVVWKFQCHFQQVIGPVQKCCCRTLPSPSHKRLRDNSYHPGHLQNGDVQDQSATLFWLYEPPLHSTVHQKRVSSIFRVLPQTLLNLTTSSPFSVFSYPHTKQHIQ